jgi:WD40 repeat protein
MLLNGLKLTALTLLTLGAAATGAGYLGDLMMTPVLAGQDARPASRAEPKPIILKAERWIYRLAWMPDSRTIAAVSLEYDQKVKDYKSVLVLWDTQKGEVSLSVREESPTLVSIAFSPDGKMIASAAISSDRRNRVWSVRLLDSGTGATRKTIPLQGTVREVVFSPDGKTLAIGGQDIPQLITGPFLRTVLLWDLKQDKAKSVFRQELRVDDIVKSGQLDGLRGLVFSPDGRLLAAADVDFRVRLIDVGTGHVRQTLEGHTDVVPGLAFAPDGKTLASGGFDRTVRLWDVQTGKELRILKGNKGQVWAVAFSPDGNLLATGRTIEEDGKKSHEVILWDARSWQPKQVLHCGTGVVETLAFSPDNRILAVGEGTLEGAGAIQLWPLKDLLQGTVIGKLEEKWMIPQSTPVGLALAPDIALAKASQRKPRVAQLATQNAQIVVGPNVQVSKAYENRRHSEVILAADPNHGDRLLAGSMVLDAGTVKGGLSVVAYGSGDGGKTWAVALERKAEKGGPYYADPAVAFDPDGVAYFAALRLRPQSTPQSALEITSSRDGGHTWAAPFLAEKLPVDRPFLVVDCTNSRFRGRAYCFLSLDRELAVYRSRDGAKTFDPPKSFPCEGPAQGRGAGQGVVLTDGTLVLTYHVLTKATDQQYSLRLRRSNTGGESFLEEQFLRDYLAAPQLRINPGSPMLGADPGSRAFRDRLYLVWSERTEAGMRLMLMISKDQGVHWSEPIVISDQASLREGDQGSSRYAFLPSIAVNRAGIVAVSWYEATLRERKLTWNFLLRASLDGGSTWLPSVRVSEVASGDTEDTWVGDTAGLAADIAGVFHPLWIDNRTGAKQVFTAAVLIK